MAATNDLGGFDPSAGGKRGASAAATMASAAALAAALCSFNDTQQLDAVAVPAAKRTKLHHSGAAASFLEAKETAYTPKCDERDGRLLRLPSPTDVRIVDPSMMGGSGSQSKVPAKIPSIKCSRIKTLPPTLKGIADAARVLHASKSSPREPGEENEAGGKQTPKSGQVAPPLLLSFPTESVYMLACCVKAASSRSIRRLLSRVDSQTSLSSGDSDASYQDPSGAHQRSPSIGNFIHPPSASLEWILKFKYADRRTAPTLFVLDGHHALNFCHFTKPKTFAIRPPSFPATSGSNQSSANNSPTRPEAPSFAPLPTFGTNASEKWPSSSPMTTQAPLTPDRAIGSTQASTPVTPNNHKLQAANFSESREAFLRLASKFWPGPVTIHVQARMLGEEDVPVVLSKKPSPSSSIASVPSLPSMGDLVSAGSSNACDAGVPALPASVLIPDRENDKYYVGMQCPSHPLPRKILNEVYRGAATSNGPHAAVSHSTSSDSLPSISSMDDGGSGETKLAQNKASKNGRVRSNIAVVGCMVPRPKSSVNSVNTGATTAVDVNKIMNTLAQSAPSANNRQERDQGRIFVVDGEDNRESFSVPTCQYGRPHPVSLLIDGENRTVHLMRRGPVAKETPGGVPKETHLTKGSVYRALLEPVSPSNGQPFFKEKKGGGTGVDRVITATLSRWKIQESVTE